MLSGSGSPLDDLPDTVLGILQHHPLPAVIVEVLSERIVAASPAAQNLFVPQGIELVGLNLKSIQADDTASAERPGSAHHRSTERL